MPDHLWNETYDELMPGFLDMLEVAKRFRGRRGYVMDRTPPARLRWAPLIRGPDFEA